MPTLISPLAGKPVPRSLLVDLPRLVTAYYTGVPDPAVPAQRVAFGTSGHRGSSFDLSFNEWHVLAITQAICEYRQSQHITGPLFMGLDTHALSQPACASALEVLAAHGVDVMLSTNDEYTPTPAVSHAILGHNRGRNSGLADGIVVTPSHNPPDNGGFKYNPPNGGPAGADITAGIERNANRCLETALTGVRRMPYQQALRAKTTHRHDFLGAYVADLGNVIDYLFNHRLSWAADAAVGKTVVSTGLIDRVAARLRRRLYEVPVGFKWFSAGLLEGSLGFGGEESAGASFLRRDGTAWTTDKDGLVAAMLAAEITARCGRDPARLYAELVRSLGEPVADRVEAQATAAQKARLAALAPAAISACELAGEAITAVLDHAPGNGAAIGGIKVITKSGWFAARPSGTEDIYKIYAESFSGSDHLQRILKEAQAIVDCAIAAP